MYNIIKTYNNADTQYEPDEYPGLKCFYYTDVDKHLYAARDSRGESQRKKITTLIFVKGSINITGAKSWAQVIDTYTFINTILKDNFDQLIITALYDQKNASLLCKLPNIITVPECIYIKRRFITGYDPNNELLKHINIIKNNTI